ncbi:hypothetical protein ACFQ3Z_09140 [Streptomyces nogalater]
MKAAGVDEVACLIDFGVEEKAALDALTHLATVRRSATSAGTRRWPRPRNRSPNNCASTR